MGALQCGEPYLVRLRWVPIRMRRSKMANEDQAKGKAKDIGGKVKEEVGDATHNDDMKRDGQADQVEGKVQKKTGDIKDKLSE